MSGVSKRKKMFSFSVDILIGVQGLLSEDTFVCLLDDGVGTMKKIRGRGCRRREIERHRETETEREI